MSDGIDTTKPCVIKSHFTCDGTGKMCNICGESEVCCGCDDEDLGDCTDCDGTGKFCVEHDSPCGDMRSPPQCDAVKKK